MVCVCVVCVCGVCVWGVCVGCVCGVCVWGMCVVCVCRVCVCVVCVCGMERRKEATSIVVVCTNKNVDLLYAPEHTHIKMSSRS